MTYAWDDERATYAWNAWVAGQSASIIARGLIEKHGDRLSRNAVIGKLMRLGAPKRVSPQIDRVEAASRGTSKRKTTRSQRTSPINPKTSKHKHVEIAADPIEPLNITLDELDAALRPRFDHETNTRPEPRFVCRAVTLTTEWGKPRYCGHDASGTYCDAHRARFYVTIKKKPRRLGASGVNRRADYRDSARWGAR